MNEDPNFSGEALTEKDVAHIAHLARLSLSADERRRYAAELAPVLSLAQSLQQFVTTDTEETHQVGGQQNVVREDEPDTPLALNEVLANAPAAADSYFAVPDVLNSNDTPE